MTLTDDDIRARVETRLKAINAELEVFTRLTAEKAALEGLIADDCMAISQMVFLVPLLGGSVAVEVVSVEPAEPVKAKTKQNEPGSKAWIAGRKARDDGKSDVDPMHAPETVAAIGYRLGWRERDREINPLTPVEEIAPAPLPVSALQSVDRSPLEWGSAAHAAGQPRSANPHKNGSQDFLEWRRGWDAAFVATQDHSGDATDMVEADETGPIIESKLRLK